MRSLRSNILVTLFLFLLIAGCAWPLFVSANFLISLIIGEGNILDSLQHEPKRKLLDAFIHGYKSSIFITGILGLIAAIDFQILAKNKLTGYIAGIFIPIFCIAIAFIYFPDPSLVLPAFALTGLFLWILYKFVDIGLRLRLG